MSEPFFRTLRFARLEKEGRWRETAGSVGRKTTTTASNRADISEDEAGITREGSKKSFIRAQAVFDAAACKRGEQNGRSLDVDFGFRPASFLSSGSESLAVALFLFLLNNHHLQQPSTPSTSPPSLYQDALSPSTRLLPPLSLSSGWRI